jgi:hypothetical protein
MSDTINEVMGRLEEQQRQSQQRELALYQVPETAHDYLKEVYQDPRVPTHLRMRAAIEALPFERPKLAVTAVLEGEHIAQLLDQRLKKIAQERSEQTNPGVAAPPQIPDRRYRR